jgi:predicted membrane protein
MGDVSQPSPTQDRPAQVTVAVGIAMLGSVFVVLAVWDRISGLHSMDTRDSLNSVLAAPVFKDSGWTVAELRAVLKGIAMVAAACATAIAVLGISTLRRSRPARLAMTVLAVPMFVAGLFADGIFSSGVAAAVATLWFGQSRMWFEESAASLGRDLAPYGGTARQRPPERTPDRAPEQRQPPAPPPHGWAPPLTSAYDAPRGNVDSSVVTRRPHALVSACLVTWFFCGLTVLLGLMTLALLAADTTSVLQRMHQQDPQLATAGISDHQVLVICWVTGSLLVLWATFAGVMAGLVYRRRKGAWHILLASTAAVIVVALFGVLASVVLLVPLVAAVATLVLLVRPDVKAWFGS